MKSKLLSAVLVSGILSSAAVYAQTTQYDVTNANPISTTSDVSSPNTVSGPYAITDESVTTQASNGDDDLLVYPNPMTSQGNIQFNLAAADNITITIYDMQGNQVKTITMGNQTPGNHQVTFASSGLREGTYFASLTGDNFRKVSKFVVVK